MPHRPSLLSLILSATFIAAGTSLAAPNSSKVGVFRSGFYWLEDVDGNMQFNDPPDRAFAFGGVPGDIPITGDWSGSGSSNVGIYRPSNGLFILDYDGDGQFTAADKVYNLGIGTDLSDIPVVGDWNGDGRTKVGLFRQGYFWILDTNGDGVFEEGVDATYAFGGVPCDLPVVGDWTGSGISKIGLFRMGFFWILDSNGDGSIDEGDATFPFGGVSGDVPLVGDWNGDGTSKVGVFRDGFFWVLDSNGNHVFDGTGPGQDLAFAFGGIPGDRPVVGKWSLNAGGGLPAISIATPASGSTVSGEVYVSAAASGPSPIASVQFFLDGAAIGVPVASFPYAILWNSAPVPNGSHAVTAMATDTSNNTATSSAITLIVSNPITSPVTLSIQKTGTGSGTVSSPGSINCGTTCAVTLNAGTVMTLTATPASGSLFSGWAGACTGSAPSCTAVIGSTATITASFTLPANGSGGAPVISDLVEMNNGTDGAVVTPAIATSDTLPTVGGSGVWANGPAGPPVELYVSKSSGIAIPARGPVQIGTTLIPDTGSTGMFRKHAGLEYDFISYNLSPAIANSTLAVGLYMYYTGFDGAAADGNSYDTFSVQSVNGDFMSINMIAGSTLTFRIETQECPSAIPLASAATNKWYWFSAVWDPSALLATLELYDPSTWTLVGSASCTVTNDPISAIWLGDTGQHGNAPVDADFYMDDLMIDVTGAHNASNPLLPATAP